ncbi:MAG: Gfo/Idh/MocA family oxidoreductase [candidate division KSB1 bacterium]|nr:Gfo/Idh/MocA family oxidoreductase [candidate division KSB1 bacterium]MDZ7319009.1 Gfo/Idh/MocA family oxidoreductase [candidate division KSB1 bacterium]MDZ7339797.1 Gfo/Idh/MocA family oxidoreductase [candidate division KSB1 bacterium]
MEDKTLKIAVVGATSIAQIVHLPMLARMKNVKLVALCDPDLALAQPIARHFNIPQVYPRLEELLQKESLDAVDICNPLESRFDSAIIALQRGLHVLIEKPFAANRVQAEQMVQTARAQQRKIMVLMSLRFRPDAIILKSVVNSKQLGEVFYVKAGWLRRNEKWLQAESMPTQEGGLLATWGVQLIDLGLWLLGNPVVHRLKAVNFNRIYGAELPDSSLIVMHLADSRLFTIEIGWNLRTGKDFIYLNLLGNLGAARLNPLTILKKQGDQLIDMTPALKMIRRKPYLKSYESQLAHFVFCILNNQPIQASAEEILTRWPILDAISLSAQSGREVELA